MEELVKNSAKLRPFLKQMIIETLKLEDISAADIDDEAPLFKDGLGLDSIDALELVVAIENTFDVVIEDEDVGKRAFGSIRALAAFIQDSFSGSNPKSLSAAG